MPPLNTSRWTIDPEYIELLNFLIERTENVESPMSIKRVARDFKKKSGAALTVKCLQQRIERVRKIIHSFEHIDTKTKVKMLFTLSASVNPEFLKELKKDAFVENDDQKRITQYKAYDGSLELKGDHSLSAKISTAIQESKRRSLLTCYFEKKNNADTVPKNKREEEMWSFIEFITEKCENADSPLSMRQLAEDFVGKFRTSIPSGAVRTRIRRYGLEIQRMEFVDTRSKVKQLFGLSATVNSDCLEKLRKNALVEVDEKDRITYYKANDESIELRGDHSLSAKTKTAKLNSKRSHQKLIRDYFEKKKNADAVPMNEEEKETWSLIDLITEKCENRNSPLNITRMIREFNEHFGIPVYSENIRKRIRSYCREIQKAEFLDTQTNVKQLFGLSASVNSDYLEILRKDAHVEVDNENHISYYKANNGDLELRGDHSLSAKISIAKQESKRSFRSLMNSYFEKKNDPNAVPVNEEEKEMWNLIEFINEKCENVNTPLSISRLATGFKNRFGLSIPSETIRTRIRRYCQEIQIVEFLDTSSKVNQMFGLGVTLDLEHLEKLRKDAVVEVDDLNRITKYTANDGSLTLHGDHSNSAKMKSTWVGRRKSEKTVKKHPNSDSDRSEESETEDGLSDEDSDEYSSEEFDSEFNSDDENLDETGDHVEPSNKADDFDNETPVRNRSSTQMSIDNDFDFDPPTEKAHTSEETEMKETGGEETNPAITGNAVIKTRSGRLCKKRHLDSEFSYNLANFGSSEATMSTNSASSKPAKQQKIAIEKEESARTTREKSPENMENQDAPSAEDNISDYHEPRFQEMEDYDYNPREDNTPVNYSLDNRIQESGSSVVKEHNKNIEEQHTDNKSDTVAPEPKPEKESLTPQNNKNSTPPTNGKEVISQEVPVKVEQEELVGNPSKDVKPETTHNFKIKFFNAMKSLILFLNTPFLSNLQSNIKQKIRKIGKSGEMISNDEMILTLELLAARMTNHSVVDISEGVESVSLIQFFCFLKASILNSKMIGVEGLVENISKRIEESQNKRIPMGKVANALRATLDIVDGF